jgi:DNA excision repair protein ERCC-2
MKFMLDGLVVYFPYAFIYPEQYRYMLELKRALDARGHCLLEVRQAADSWLLLLVLVCSYMISSTALQHLHESFRGPQIPSK